jgi:O-antigen/teichoic acid export membrane protein
VLFGESYRAAIPAALVLILAGTILGLNSVLEEGLLGLGHPYAILWAELAGLITTGAGLALTLRRLGLMGGAISSLAGYSTVCAALLYAAHRLIGTTPAMLLRPRIGEMVLGVDRVRSLLQAIAGATE